MLHVLYFVHDLADPAVRRRVLTLQIGGARVTLAGFRRDENPLASIEGVQPIELGRTHDGRFAQRMTAIARSMAHLSRSLRHIERPDVIIARNLEMLAVANRAVSLFGGDMPLVYECLDIHRLLLRKDVAGTAIRAAERHLGAKARLLLTSSPAFVEHYFRPLSALELPTMVLENKVLVLDGDLAGQTVTSRVPAQDMPWKIGWFGALRCRKSLALLADFSRRMQGRFEIVLRGRPARSEFEDFDGFVEREPFMRFLGSYKNPEELSDIYGEVQFSWAIDFFEEGLNSNWLLPNRLYEGCLHGAVPIAMQGTETARFLSQRNLGLMLDEAAAGRLSTLMSDMDEGRYLDAFNAIAAMPPRTWITDRSECQALVQRLASMTSATRPSLLSKAVSQPHGNKGGLL